jgi:hypothetical protein
MPPPDGAGAMVRTDEHVAAREKVVLAPFATGHRVARNHRRPPTLEVVEEVDRVPTRSSAVDGEQVIADFARYAAAARPIRPRARGGDLRWCQRQGRHLQRMRAHWHLLKHPAAVEALPGPSSTPHRATAWCRQFTKSTRSVAIDMLMATSRLFFPKGRTDTYADTCAATSPPHRLDAGASTTR